MKRYKPTLPKDFLTEMAKPLKWIIEKIRAEEPQVNKHLLKILLFNTKSTYARDVSSWLVSFSTYIIKGSNGYLKKGQYFELLFNEPFEQDSSINYSKSNIRKYCSSILEDTKYKKLYSRYRTEEIPVDNWKNILEQFYIEIDDYLSKGILDAQIANYLIEEYIVKSAK